jgi:hypothetical protein
MTLGLSSDQVVAICAVLGVAGTVIAWVLRNKDAAQELEIKTMKERQADLKSNLDTAWRKIDELREGRGAMWTRVEQKEFENKIETTTKDLRSEIRADLETLGSRLSGDLANLGNRLDNSIRELMSKR